MNEVKKVIDALDTAKFWSFVIFVLFILIVVGQIIERQYVSSIRPQPFFIAALCFLFALTSEGIQLLIKYGRGDDPKTETSVADEDAPKLLANIQQARAWLIEASSQYATARRTLNMTHDALDAAEAEAKKR